MDDQPLAPVDAFAPLAEEPRWPEGWWYLRDEPDLRVGLQRELHAELSAAHPLWGLQPVVVAKCDRSDDVLVRLRDGRFAFVHLVWHGKVDPVPDAFPATRIVEGLAALQAELEGGG